MWVVLALAVDDFASVYDPICGTFDTQEDAEKAASLLGGDSDYISHEAHELPEPMTYEDWVNAGHAYRPEPRANYTSPSQQGVIGHTGGGKCSKSEALKEMAAQHGYEIVDTEPVPFNPEDVQWSPRRNDQD